LVSIIVPTRDQVKLLRSCITSVLTGTHYHPYELIIVDNGSVEPETHAYFQQVGRNPAVRILQYDAPYNFSAINNFAVKHAKGSYICLLNNDTEVLDDQWLTELMRQATRPEVGAVGAKLLYADGSIQHAGVVIGLGEAAGHAHRYLRGNKPGYFHRPHVTHYVSAVTAACLLVSKEKFDAVGGLDADGLQIAFNDVDFCLKLERAGWQNIYTPMAKLVHHESKSRGKDISPEHITRYMGELAILQQRWGTINYNDPLHHPNLDRYHETYVIRL
jgi:O-antigen biosynthesis protein